MKTSHVELDEKIGTEFLIFGNRGVCMGRRFYRKINDKIIGGVCSGLADYIGMDKSIVRLLAFVAILASGVLPAIVYFLCVIIVPYDVQANRGSHYDNHDYGHSYHEESTFADDREYGEPGNGRSRVIFGTLLIAAGVFLLARMFFAWLDWRYVFAGLLVISGLYMLFDGRRA